MVNDDLEFYANHRAERSMRRSDVVLLMIDATLRVADPDKKLGRLIADLSKPAIIVVNKWDLAKEGFRDAAQQQRETLRRTDDRILMDQFRHYLREEMPGLSYAPIAFTTAKDGTQVGAVLDLARRLQKQAVERVGTGKLNRALEDAVNLRPPPSKNGRRARVYYATQVSIEPPTIVLFVNEPKLFEQSYQRFLLNRLRESLPYGEVPVRLYLRGKPDREAQEEGRRDVAVPAEEGVGRRDARKTSPSA
jgi:GTP-binding protein